MHHLLSKELCKQYLLFPYEILMVIYQFVNIVEQPAGVKTCGL